MRRLLHLVALGLAFPAALISQDRASIDVAVMAAALKHVQPLYDPGGPLGFPAPTAGEPTAFRLNSTTNPGLVSQLAAAVALDTVALERAEKDCRSIFNARQDARTLTVTYCRFTQIRGMLGASLAAISGDTAKVDVQSWVNDRISDDVWRVTLVREADVWRAVHVIRLPPRWVS